MLDAHQQPHQFPRRLLVAVTGLSPQIVTETLYALAVAPSASAFLPTEIHLITTRSGAEKARLALLSDEPGWFHRLRGCENILPSPPASVAPPYNDAVISYAAPCS